MIIVLPSVQSDVHNNSSLSHSIMNPGRLSNGSWYIMVSTIFVHALVYVYNISNNIIITYFVFYQVVFPNAEKK